jgi:hypothetical protein
MRVLVPLLLVLAGLAWGGFQRDVSLRDGRIEARYIGPWSDHATSVTSMDRRAWTRP